VRESIIRNIRIVNEPLRSQVLHLGAAREEVYISSFARSDNHLLGQPSSTALVSFVATPSRSMSPPGAQDDRSNSYHRRSGR